MLLKTASFDPGRNRHSQTNNLLRMWVLYVILYVFSGSATYVGMHTVGDSDPGVCDTEAKHVEVFKNHTQVDEYVFSGMTTSMSLISGRSVSECLIEPVPFMQVWSNSALLFQRYFPEEVYMSADGLKGRYTDVTCTKYADMNHYGSFYFHMTVLCLQVTDTSGTTRANGTSIAMFDSTGTLFKDMRIMLEPPRQQGLAVESSSTFRTTRIYVIFYPNPSARQFIYYYCSYSGDKLYPYSHTARMTGYEPAFGITLVTFSDYDWLFAGSVTKSGFPGFFPAIIDHGRHIFEPTSTAAPYYAIDTHQKSFIGSPFKIWYMGVPRDANYNILDSSHPYFVTMSKITGCYEQYAMFMVTIQQGSTPYFLMPLEMTIDDNVRTVMIFKSSATVNNMTIGSDTESIVTVAFPDYVTCASNIASGLTATANSATAAVSNTASTISLNFDNFYGRYGRVCYVPSGVGLHCDVTGAGMISHNNSNFFWVGTTRGVYQDQTYNQDGMLSTTDSTAHLTYSNSNSTHNGKFMVIQNSINSQTATSFIYNHPTYGSTYPFIVYSPAISERNATFAVYQSSSTIYPRGEWYPQAQSPFCNSSVYTISQSTAFPEGSRNLAGWVNLTGGWLEFPDPLFTYSCTGNTSLCNDCPIASRMRVSTSSTTFTPPTAQLSAEAFKNQSSGNYYIGYDNSSMNFQFALQYELYNTDNLTLLTSLLTDYVLDVSLTLVPQPVTVIPEPCVSEQLVTFSYIKTLLLLETPDLETLKIDLNTYFKYDDTETCQASLFKITAFNSTEDFADTTGNLTKFFTIQDEFLSIDMTTESEGEFTFYIMVQIIDGTTYAWKEVYFNLANPSVESKIPEIINQPPDFTEGETIIEEVKIDVPLEIGDDSIYLYTSPVAVDKESNKIYYEFEGGDDLQYVQVKQNKDDTFTLRIDQSLITEDNVQNFTLKVRLTDDKALFKNQFAIPVYLTKEVLVVENTTETASNETAEATEEEQAEESTEVIEEDEEEEEEEEIEENPSEEKKKEVGYDEYASPKPKPPAAPPVVVLRLPGTNVIPPRKNVPVDVVAYDNPEDQFLRQEPTISNLAIDKNGIVKVSFTNDMKMLAPWKIKAKRDAKYFQNQAGPTQEQTKRLLQGEEETVPMAFVKLYMKRAGVLVERRVKSNQILLKGLDPKKIEMKILFRNPSTVSLSSQSELDNMVVKLSKRMILNDLNGNSLVMDKGVARKNNIEIDIPVQPQVSEAQEIKDLEEFADTLQNIMNIVMITQLVMSNFFSSGFEAFMSLIGSQQNLAYLPALSLNNPGQVSLYLEVLVELIGFDPIPIDMISDYLGIFDFEWTNEPPTRESLGTIGFEDRIFIYILGSVFLFLSYYVLTQIASFLISFWKDHYRVRPIYNFLNIETPKTQIMILFYLEIYTELLIGAFINNENLPLIDIPSNWGPGGNLNTSDQFTIILGFVIGIPVFFFPVFVIYILERKRMAHFETLYDEVHFDETFGILYEENRVDTPGVLQFYSIYLLRRTIFVMLVWYLNDPGYALVQVMVTIFSGFFYVLYLFEAKPFIDTELNRLQIINELFFLCVVYHMLVFTDYSPTADTKIMAGWSMLFVSIANVIYPNLTGMVAAMAPDIINSCKKQPEEDEESSEEEGEGQAAPKTKKAALKSMRRNKQKLLQKYKEMIDDQVEKTFPIAMLHQVLPEQPNIISTFEKRRRAYRSKKKIKKMKNMLGIRFKEDPHQLVLSRIEEDSQDLIKEPSSMGILDGKASEISMGQGSKPMIEPEEFSGNYESLDNAKLPQQEEEEFIQILDEVVDFEESSH